MVELCKQERVATNLSVGPPFGTIGIQPGLCKPGRDIECSRAFEALLEARGARMVPLPMPEGLPPWANVDYTQGDVTNWTDEDEG